MSLNNPDRATPPFLQEAPPEKWKEGGLRHENPDCSCSNLPAWETTSHLPSNTVSEQQGYFSSPLQEAPFAQASLSSGGTPDSSPLLSWQHDVFSPPSPTPFQSPAAPLPDTQLGTLDAFQTEERPGLVPVSWGLVDDRPDAVLPFFSTLRKKSNQAHFFDELPNTSGYGVSSRPDSLERKTGALASQLPNWERLGVSQFEDSPDKTLPKRNMKVPESRTDTTNTPHAPNLSVDHSPDTLSRSFLQENFSPARLPTKAGGGLGYLPGATPKNSSLAQRAPVYGRDNPVGPRVQGGGGIPNRKWWPRTFKQQKWISVGDILAGRSWPRRYRVGARYGRAVAYIGNCSAWLMGGPYLGRVAK